MDSKLYKSAYQVSMFEESAPQYDAKKTKKHGKIFTLTRDKSGDGKIDVDDLDWSYLEGDGDFKSKEVIKLRDEADIIITNPPFSLFRDFLAWIVEGDKRFLIIGNINAIKYKSVFPLIKANKMWTGSRFNQRINGKNMTFNVPDDYELSGTEVELINGKKMISVAGTGWYTNIDHGRRHQPLHLMTMADNLRFNKRLKGKNSYDKYENFQALEIPFTDTIPSDFDGVMGVPITFLTKFSPEQFEIIGLSMRDGFGIRDHKKYDNYKETRQDGTSTGSSGKKTNGNPMLRGKPIKGNYYIDEEGNCSYSLYDRIFIVHKNPA
jgi:hypothetical protein